MDEWSVAVVLIGASVLAVAGLVGLCRILGGWTYLLALASGSEEERAQLSTREEPPDISHYPGYPPPRTSGIRPQFIPQQSFSENLKAVEKMVPTLPPPPDNPRRLSLDAARRASLDTDLPDILTLEAGANAKLQRAMSCDSVCSDTSVVLDTIDSPQHNGELDVSLEYSMKSEELIVNVIQARGLTVPDFPGAKVDSYVRVFLHPDESTILQTALRRNNRDAEYNERFVFKAEKNSLPERTVKCSVYACDRSNNISIGQAEVKMASIDIKQIHRFWLPLVDGQKKLLGCGELLFSLSYLPTAERLTVVMVKARNLVWTEGKESSDPFVKIYLLQKGKKISKKKTSVKKGDRNPVFNEAMIFSVPASSLQNIQLRLTVSENQGEGKTPAVGHVFIGPHCSGKQLSHWNQMISAPRKPIAMWHPLKKREE